MSDSSVPEVHQSDNTCSFASLYSKKDDIARKIAKLCWNDNWNWNELKWVKKCMSLAENVIKNHNKGSPSTKYKYQVLQDPKKHIVT